MEDVAIIFTLTLTTINVCGFIYVLKFLIEVLSKAVHYKNLIDKEMEQ